MNIVQERFVMNFFFIPTILTTKTKKLKGVLDSCSPSHKELIHAINSYLQI